MNLEACATSVTVLRTTLAGQDQDEAVNEPCPFRSAEGSGNHPVLAANYLMAKASLLGIVESALSFASFSTV